MRSLYLVAAAASVFGVPDDACAGKAEGKGFEQHQQFLKAIDAKRFDVAAAMIVGDAVVEDEAAKVVKRLPARVFVEWITHCAKGGLDMEMPPLADGTYTRSYHLRCEHRRTDGSFVAGTFPVKLAFSIGANGRAVRVQR